jgi:hypothetical protein
VNVNGNTIKLTPEESLHLAAGQEAMRMEKNSFDRWILIGHAIVGLRAAANRIDGDKKKTPTFNELLRQNGFERLADRANTATTSRLLKIMDKLDAVLAWRAPLTESEKWKYASPLSVVRHCPVFNKPTAEPKAAKLSPFAKLQEANRELVVAGLPIKGPALDKYDYPYSSPEAALADVIHRAVVRHIWGATGKDPQRTWKVLIKRDA